MFDYKLAMYKYIVQALLAFLLLLFPAVANADTTARTAESEVDSLYALLCKSRSHTDSLLLMQNIYDLTQEKSLKINILKSIYNVANATEDSVVRAATLVHLANAAQKNVPMLKNVAMEMDSLPDSPRKKEGKLFVDMLITDAMIANDTLSASAIIDSLAAQFRRAPANDPYARVAQLFALCRRLSGTTTGELLEQYYRQLENTVESIPLQTGAVRNLIYTRGAHLFTSNGNYGKAIEIDKKMLTLIDSLVSSYAAAGRPFRKHEPARYFCYTRLLSNYKGLSNNERTAYYNRILNLAKVNPYIAADLKNNERAHIYYYISTGEWKKAIDAIKRQIDKPNNRKYRLQYLQALYEAAENIGDKDTQLEAAVQLNKNLSDKITKASEQRYRELQIIYEMNKLQSENANLKASCRRDDIKNLELIYIIAGVSIIALLVLIFILFYQNRKIRRMSARQQKTTERIRSERNELQGAQRGLIEAREEAKKADRLKTDFINNMSHEVKTPLAAIVEYSRLIVDCIPGEKSKYLNKFADIIELNAGLVLTIMNDVLDIASLEHGQMTVEKQPVCADMICKLALANVFENNKSSKSGVRVIYEPGDETLKIDTDMQRVCQVLMNMLSNAEKFTDKGSITLGYRLDDVRDVVEFYVADTGIGIPKGTEETIFDRFRQLDASAPGCGLGLYVSRLLATLLGGTVKVDTSYRGGARFVFTIPV
ncbi:MAG: HAMP domain-containing histidine kinase [Muribaculaceae bacterium]|nr:HAMP domain-containing histidine kinase [Muribaculaceae bacterium]